MYKAHFLYLLLHQWIFGFFHILAIVTNAAVDMGVQINLQDPDSNTSEWMPKNEFARSWGRSTVNFRSTCHTIFCSGCISLPSYQRCTGVPVSAHSYQQACVDISLWLWCAFPWRFMILSVFSCASWNNGDLPNDFELWEGRDHCVHRSVPTVKVSDPWSINSSCKKNFFEWINYDVSGAP